MSFEFSICFDRFLFDLELAQESMRPRPSAINENRAILLQRSFIDPSSFDLTISMREMSTRSKLWTDGADLNYLKMAFTTLIC